MLSNRQIMAQLKGEQQSAKTAAEVIRKNQPAVKFDADQASFSLRSRRSNDQLAAMRQARFPELYRLVERGLVENSVTGSQRSVVSLLMREDRASLSHLECVFGALALVEVSPTSSQIVAMDEAGIWHLGCDSCVICLVKDVRRVKDTLGADFASVMEVRA